MPFQVLLLGLVLVGPSTGNPTIYDWKVISVHRSDESCQRAKTVFDQPPSFRDVQCVTVYPNPTTPR